jgi:hypothetical protein
MLTIKTHLQGVDRPLIDLGCDQPGQAIGPDILHLNCLDKL